MRDLPFQRVVTWMILVGLLFPATGCFQFRQIPVSPADAPANSDDHTIEETLPLLAQEKAFVRLLLRDVRSIENRLDVSRIGRLEGDPVVEGRIVHLFDPYLRVQSGKQTLDINKAGIIKVYRLEVHGENTVNLMAGVLGFALVVGVFILTSMEQDN